MGRWRTFLQLPGAERWILIQVLLLLPLVALAIQLLGLRRVQHQLSHWMPIGKPQADLDAASLAYLVELAARRGPYPANCLQRSLVLWWLLGRHGRPGVLKIGVQKVADQILAHAWVELDGYVLNDRPDVRQEYNPFEAAITPCDTKLL